MVNSPNVVHETIDGETIVIHLGTGTYYSLDGVGAEAWNLLADGADEAGLMAAAGERYEGDPEQIRGALSALVDDLVREELLVETQASQLTASPQLPPGRVPFAAPTLSVYTDMREFMLVDPLHEVDEAAGWPHTKAG